MGVLRMVSPANEKRTRDVDMGHEEQRYLDAMSQRLDRLRALVQLYPDDMDRSEDASKPASDRE